MNRRDLERHYLALCASVSDRYDQQPRRPDRLKWLRAVAGAAQPITPAHLLDHLAGRATYAAAYTDAEGMATLAVADDDHGGAAAAQTAVDHLSQHYGVAAWAIARRSLDDQGQPRHDGSRLFVVLAAPAHKDDLRRALAAMLAPTGYSIDEIMRRAELPFGRSRWAPAGDAWGTLILPGATPIKITSGAQGLDALIRGGGLVAIAPERILRHAPPIAPAPPPAPAPRRTTTADGATIVNGHRAVVDAFNAAYATHDVLSWQGWHKIGARAYRCGCPAHKHGDRLPSIGVAADGGVFFNAPHCAYHNQGRAYTAFGLWQHLAHGGDYRQAVDAARDLLDMPFRIERPAAAPRAAAAPSAPAAAHDDLTVARLIEEIGRRVRAGADKLSTATVNVLRAVCRLAREMGGRCQIAWDALADRAGCTTPTARRAVALLVHLGYLAKHAATTARGQFAPNVLELLPQPAGGEHDHYPRHAIQAHADADMITTHVTKNDQSIVNTIKRKEINTPVEKTKAPPDFSSLNSPPAVMQSAGNSASAPVSAGAVAAMKQRLRDLAAPLVSAAPPADGRTAAAMNAMPDPDLGRPAQRQAAAAPPRADFLNGPTEDDNLPIGAWLKKRAAERRQPPAPTPVAVAETAPPKPAPVPLAELAPLLDQAVAAGDQDRLRSLLDRLGAWDRALANGTYGAALCKFRPQAGRAA